MNNRTESAELFVSYDKSNVTVRLYADNIYNYYKDCRAENKQFVNCDFIEMPNGTVTPDGYYYSLRGKKSLKEYICGEGTTDIRMLRDILAALESVSERTTEFNIQLSDIVFDYNCVFLQSTGKGYSFVYMPGASLAKNAPSVGDLVNVVFFNADAEETDAEFYDALKNLVNDVETAQGMSELFAKIKLLRTKIDDYLEANKSFAEKLKKKLQIKADKKYDRKIEVMSNNRVLFEKLVKKGEEEKIRIGRDETWADLKIDNAFSSRKHAELLIAKDGSVSVFDYSLNGTFVNGEEANQEKNCRAGEDGISLRIGRDVELLLKIEKISA